MYEHLVMCEWILLYKQSLFGNDVLFNSSIVSALLFLFLFFPKGQDVIFNVVNVSQLLSIELNLY